MSRANFERDLDAMPHEQEMGDRTQDLTLER